MLYRNFVFIDPVKQSDWYSFARDYTKCFPWGKQEAEANGTMDRKKEGIF